MYTTQISLLERLRDSKDRQSWDRFIQLYTPLLCHWARRLGVEAQDNADFVQDVFAILVQKLPSFRYEPAKRFRGWLWTVTLNIRRQSKRKGGVQANGNVADLEGCLAAGNGEAAEEAEYQKYLIGRALQLAQADFQPTTWKACWEHVISDRPAADVAAELGMSVGAVYVAKSRVLRRLRQELGVLLD